LDVLFGEAPVLRLGAPGSRFRCGRIRWRG